jgi:hypothetical protein
MKKGTLLVDILMMIGSISLVLSFWSVVPA